MEISIPLTAPQNPGEYTVVWQLVNAWGEVIEVDKGNIWASIRVGGGTAGVPPVFAKGVTVSLNAIQVGETETRAELCFEFDFPYGNEWVPQEVYLLAGGKTYDWQGGPLGTYPFTCVEAFFSVGKGELSQYEVYQISVGKIGNPGLLTNQQGKCEALKAELQAQYPGLNFTCLPVTAGRYYSNLEVPSGVSREHIETLIVNAMQDTISGPWEFTLVP